MSFAEAMAALAKIEITATRDLVWVMVGVLMGAVYQPVGRRQRACSQLQLSRR
jgi:hypothetical protein